MTSSNANFVNDDPNIIINSNDTDCSLGESFILSDRMGEEYGSDSPIEELRTKKVLLVRSPTLYQSYRLERQAEPYTGIKVPSILLHPSKKKKMPLNLLSLKFNNAVATMKKQWKEINSMSDRIREDGVHAIATSKKHQDDIRSTGVACEFYQSIRQDLTLWVGALQDLQEKVEIIATSFRKMLQIQTTEFDHEFRAWQDDCVTTLYQANRLDCVLGRQPEITLLLRVSNANVIDDFGRDTHSQHLRDRKIRFKRRMKFMKLNADTNCVIRSENHEEEKRSKILQGALVAAIEDLDQQYTSLLQLKTIFDGWFETYFDDYQQCFATLNLGGLSAVFIQVDFLKTNFFPDLLMSTRDSALTPAAISSTAPEPSIFKIGQYCSDLSIDEGVGECATNKFYGSEVAIENGTRITSAVQKSLLPMLFKILNDDNNSSFCLFFSSIKSWLISRLVNDVAIKSLHRVPNNHSCCDVKLLGRNVRKQIQYLISSAIKKALCGISLPLMNTNSKKAESRLPSPSDELDYSVKFATFYLIRILQQALCNIIIHWFPLLEIDANSKSHGDIQAENGIHYVLNFVNEKYLVLLSSIDGGKGTNSKTLPSARDFFKPLWEALNKESRNILESPSLILKTTPLRAAARAFKLKCHR